MIIKVPDIPGEGLTIGRKALEDAPFSDPAWRLDGLRLQLERDGPDVLAHGEIRATVPQVCGRCLEPFGARVTAGVDVRVAPRPATADNVELAADDLDVAFYAKDELDLNVLVETETTLALPMKPLCREDCLGLCPVCGGDPDEGALGGPDRPPGPPRARLLHLAARGPRPGGTSKPPPSRT